jgi:hypothetical protein
MNALEESYRDKADEIFEKVQKRINKKGSYENAGQDEIRKYEEEVSRNISDFQTRCRLSEYINNKIDNCLDYN